MPRGDRQGEASTMPIHAMILARDEAHNLPECIASLRMLTSDITVCDTGSNDQTPELARSIGVSTRAIPWRDDFSQARNAALGFWRSGWVLVVDADERLSSASLESVRDAVETADDDYTVIHMQVRSYTDDVERLGYSRLPRDEVLHRGSAGFVGTVEPRLFRADRGLHFVGRVGERLCDARGVAIPVDPGTVGTLHHGREQESIQRCRQRTRLRLGLALRQFLETGDPQAAALVGVLLNDAGQWKQALSYLREAEKAPEAGVAVFMQAGVARLHLGLVDGAAAAFERAWQQAPGHPEVATWWARALLAQGGSLHEARGLLEDAWEEAPDLDLAVVLLGQVSRRQGHLDEAKGWLQALLEDNPVHPLALKELGSIALLQQRPHEAEKHLRQALRLRPHDPELLNNLGCALERLGFWDQALATFTQGLLHAGDDVRLLRNRCMAQAACDRWRQLESDVERLLLVSDSPRDDWLILRERLLEGGWIAALRHLDAWAARAGWHAADEEDVSGSDDEVLEAI
jgi:tetratricopeptide (TPR) repeat protein